MHSQTSTSNQQFDHLHLNLHLGLQYRSPHQSYDHAHSHSQPRLHPHLQPHHQYYSPAFVLHETQLSTLSRPGFAATAYPPSTAISTAGHTMASISDEDMATLQKLSNDYEPEVEVAVMAAYDHSPSHALTSLLGASCRPPPIESCHHYTVRPSRPSLRAKDGRKIPLFLPFPLIQVTCTYVIFDRLSLIPIRITGPCGAMAIADGEVSFQSELSTYWMRRLDTI